MIVKVICAKHLYMFSADTVYLRIIYMCGYLKLQRYHYTFA